MILTKEMAEKAKEFIGDDEGVCWAIEKASNRKISIYNQSLEFWAGSDYPCGCYKWQFTPEGDEKRRIFIDSLIGKDL